MGNLAVLTSRYADDRTGIEIITGETPDISEYIDFGFYASNGRMVKPLG